MDSQRVSVVIPCYNDAPEHLRQCVDSAAGQTHADVEVIVVNDGSNEESTLRALRSLNGVVLLEQENAGPGAAFNTGIAAATGTYVLPLGADDYMAPDMVELLLSRLRGAGPDVVGVYPVVEFRGERSGLMPAPPSVTLQDIAVRNRVVANTLFRRSQWELAGGYGAFNDCSEDWYFWGVLLGRTGGRLVQEPGARFFYRVRPGSRNSVNRGVERKENARRHIVEALPDRAAELYLSAARQADDAIAEADRYRSFVEGWRRRLGPVAPAYKHGHKLLTQLSRWRRPGS
ncbi:glycosyltransferase family 2 protein [Ornithinimicrobium avium]|uniref:Glycosyltransferase family 2 protein n=1 Tax=Ornithinimicrobium avium TaxID=2283195 RepID=A0A345NPC9_9MICO|nr:glycosyltransferase family A protein [Ornithinimicrobium avium]AXH96887.1 glycosyltransferase family 2 protein [Ornithinimicrobium avium]